MSVNYNQNSSSYYAAGYLKIWTRNKSNDTKKKVKDELIVINIGEFHLGKNSLNKGMNGNRFIYKRVTIIDSITNRDYFYLDSSYNNVVYAIDIDTTNKIIIGSFEFKAINKDDKEEVLITDGEFDIFYQAH